MSGTQSGTGQKIMIIDDDRDFRWALCNVIRGAGYQAVEAQDGIRGLRSMEKEPPDLILLDYRMPVLDGIRVAERLKKSFPGIPVIIVTAYGEVSSAVKAMKMGIYDYLLKPLDNYDLLFTIGRALEKKELAREVEVLKRTLSGRASLFDLMGNSNSIHELASRVEKVAPTSLTVLIEGESGTGKEIVARAIHGQSKVNEGPFIPVDCGAIPESLIESELFGYTRGAFTGAHSDRPGQFELAENGTLFLDEVGNLPYTAQQKLLRTMQERRLKRLGAKKTQNIRVRIIAATNRPLELDIESGVFRSDLYYRLNEFTIKIPPLRKRKEDIIFLFNRFTQEAEKELERKSGILSKAALNLLMEYDWPGNVRELKNVVRQAVLLCNGDTLGPEHITIPQSFKPAADTPEKNPPLESTLKLHKAELEKKILADMLREMRGNRTKAARKLGINYKTLLRKIKHHGLNL